MNIPGFTAEASLYRTSGRYRVSASEFGGSSSGQPVIPAYFPGPDTQAACNRCLSHCARNNVICNTLAIGTIWNPILAAAAYTGCFTEFLRCTGFCTLPGLGWLDSSDCCPKVCGVPNPFNPGEGCCDVGENCVDINDKNSRRGCCPSDQNVCGGRCCAKGETCCGNECCPAGWFCDNGFCTQSLPFPGGSPPKPPKNPPPLSGLFDCAPGWTHCKDKCCPPGLHCCGGLGGTTSCQADCWGVVIVK